MPAFPDEFVSDAELLIEARNGLYDRSRLLAPDATLAAIQDLKNWIDQELAFEESASASFGRALSELWHAEYLDQLPPLLNRFERLVSAYFVRRGSVPAFHGFCNAWHHGVLQRVLEFAEEGPDLDDDGHAPAPYALLASGSMGRLEQTLEESQCYFLIWRGDQDGYFQPFAYRVIAILDQFGMLGKEGSALHAQVLWRGSFDQWTTHTELAVQAPEQPDPLELVADLRFVCGDPGIGEEAVRHARSCLGRARGSRAFSHFARQVVDRPVALGLLGGIRLERTGEHAGCVNPEESGLHPLVSAVRFLAAQYHLEVCPTLDRLSALASHGVLKAAQVEALGRAYHVLAGYKVRREIALGQPYLNPAKLSETERDQLKEALEAVRQLQRFIRCAFLGSDLARSILPG